MRLMSSSGVPVEADVDLEALVLEELDALGGELLLDQDLSSVVCLSPAHSAHGRSVMNTCSAAPTEAPHLTS